MVDLNLSARLPDEISDYSETDIRKAIELLFFAYRDFTSGPDNVLAEYGYGRAHHRVIHFVGRNPGITVQQLLGILRITKQSLSRVLGSLVRDGYVEQRQGKRDRRMRHLHLTDQGVALEAACSAPQRDRVREAFEEAGPEAVKGYAAVLRALVDPDDRSDVFSLVEDG
ncbi:MarR family winged helix-turn-helix transcriptional regulator [Minwuia sp.]|uniref:MarR family winged helix-turn-helix transcriptional regulator n=1 Tax=Minwuia sp. TaxID=2493630 RepID=UPI003A8CF41E